MRTHGLAVLLLLIVALPAAAAKHSTSSGQVAHSRRVPVAMHRMFPPFAGNHVYEKSPADDRTKERSNPNTRGERSRRSRPPAER
jgi:hypothetical protein